MANYIDEHDDDMQYFYSDAFESALPYMFLFFFFIFPILIIYLLIYYNITRNNIFKTTKKLPFIYKFRYLCYIFRYYLSCLFFHFDFTIDMWCFFHYIQLNSFSSSFKKSHFHSRN